MNVPDMKVIFEPTADAKAVQFLNVTLIPDTNQVGEVRSKMTIRTDLGGEKEITLDVTYKMMESNPQLSSRL